MKCQLEKVKREEQILLSLKRLDFLTRSQIQKLHRLGGVRNANRVLKEMEPYLHSFRAEENVYYLNKEGRERVGCDKVRKKTLQATHFIMRNDLYIFLGCPSTWQNEMRVKLGKESVIVDALYKKNNAVYLVEIDHTQQMIANKKKIEFLKEVNAKSTFKMIWLTTTEFRKKKLLELCKGLEVMVYTMNDLK